MIKIIALVRETFLEAISKKIFVGFFAISTLVLIILYLVFSTEGMTRFFQSLQPTADDPTGVALRESVRSMQVGIGGFFYTASVLLSIFITANIIPGMLEKGTIDLLISKPISRSALLFGKSLGGFLVVTTSISYFIVGAWLIISLKTGVWNLGFLYSLAPALVSFLSLFAIMVFVGITIQSAAIGMVICYLIATVISLSLYSRNELLFQFITGDIARGIINALYFTLPQIQDIGQISGQIIQNKTVTHWTSVYHALGFSALLFGASGYIFSKKEF